MRKKAPSRKRRPAPSHGVMQEELAAMTAKCAENAGRIDRLEFDYATQVRRCAELQAEIDQLKRHPLLRPAK
jgi:hypothetical protein